MNFYDKDPEKGGKQISRWEFINQILPTGIPTHNFELLKPVRQELFEKEKVKFLKERNLNGLKTTDYELNLFLGAWLNNELKEIEVWLSDTYPNGKKRGKPSISEQIEILKYKDFVNTEIERLNQISQTQQSEKPKPELNEALILFSSPEIIINLHNELKGYFQGSEAELLKALKGEHLNNLLLFPHNQNKFVEVFKRLKYNGFLLSTPKEINNWICSNFTYIRTKGDKKEVKNFNKDTIKTLLTNSAKEREAEPTQKERICTPDWLPHYWSNELKNKQN